MAGMGKKRAISLWGGILLGLLIAVSGIACGEKNELKKDSNGFFRTALTIDTGRNAPKVQKIVVKGPVQGLYFWREGAIDTSSVPAMVKSIIKPSMSDREKAQAIWQFTTTYFSHSVPSWEAANRLDNPVRLINSYGYGFCDEFAAINAALWEAAGLKSRYWFLGGHTVSEVYYEGGWHLYDSDAKEYWLNERGEVAGVEELAQNPALILKKADRLGFLATDIEAAKMAALFQDERRRIVPKPYFDNTGELAINLRQNETMIFDLVEKNPAYALPYDGDKKNYPFRCANGEIVYSPSLKDYSKLFPEDNVVKSEFKPRLRPYDSNRPAEFIVPVESPYIILGASLRVDYTRKDEKDRLEIAVSTDGGRNWEEVWQAQGVGNRQETVAVKQLDGTTRGQALYGYLLKFRIVSPAGKSGFNGFSLRTRFQFNPETMPRLTSGKNTIYIRTKSGDFSSKQIKVLWVKENSQIAFYTGPKPFDYPSSAYRYYTGFSDDSWKRYADKTLEIRVLAVKGAVVKGGIRAESYDQPGEVIFHGRITGSPRLVQVQAKAFKRTDRDRVRIYFSSNGKEWVQIWEGSRDIYPEKFPENTVNITPLLAGGGPFYLRVEIKKDASRQGEAVLRRLGVLVE